ncbi:hypothetical protein NC653_005259 [Populus alba x Populus x berolinensis]|uniref:Uncharacterized protein n=1 Tax=Populus alba x Populus x berolinensis TaxID=444605 RepID=A0AAD6RBH3_9ROSI|nr:hypothetical protein NC653_005259 [Populus alba x Populus x berolinensis]
MALWKGTWLQQEGEDKHGMNDNNSEDDSDGIRKRVLSISKSDDPRFLDFTDNKVRSSVDLTVNQAQDNIDLAHLSNPEMSRLDKQSSPRCLDLVVSQV